MKVGDYVGWKEHEEDDGIPVGAGIILEEKKDHRAEWGSYYSEFLILLDHNGGLSWEFGSDLVVINESR